VATVDLSYLLIPRRTGFWQAGLAGTCEEQTVTDLDDKPMGVDTTVSDYSGHGRMGHRLECRAMDKRSAAVAEPETAGSHRLAGKPLRHKGNAA
jgi:hypothetical protein